MRSASGGHTHTVGREQVRVVITPLRLSFRTQPGQSLSVVGPSSSHGGQNVCQSYDGASHHPTADCNSIPGCIYCYGLLVSVQGGSDHSTGVRQHPLPILPHIPGAGQVHP